LAWVRELDVAFHCRGQQDRRPGSQEGSGQHVVGQAGSQFGNGIGRRRGDDEQIAAPGQADVADLGLGQQAEHLGHDGAMGQGLKSQGGDELTGGSGEDDVNDRPALDQVAAQSSRFVGRNATRDTQDDRFARQDHGSSCRFISQIRRRPSSVNQGSTASMTAVSAARSGASPPVATTRIWGPNSARKRATMPSTNPT